jgi:hypothetical protein
VTSVVGVGSVAEGVSEETGERAGGAGFQTSAENVELGRLSEFNEGVLHCSFTFLCGLNLERSIFTAPFLKMFKKNKSLLLGES